MRVRVLYVDRAPERERRHGLLAWLTVEVHGLAVEGFALRQTLDGRPCVTFPKRKDARGRLHPQAWPTDPRDRKPMEEQILSDVAADFEELAR